MSGLSPLADRLLSNLMGAGEQVDAIAMNGNGETRRMRFWSGLLCLACLLALVPAAWLAHAAWLWLPGLEGRGMLSAVALLAGPLPFALGAFYAWRAARLGHGPSLLAGACITLLAIPAYAVAWAWGGRMLL